MDQVTLLPRLQLIMDVDLVMLRWLISPWPIEWCSCSMKVAAVLNVRGRGWEDGAVGSTGADLVGHCFCPNLGVMRKGRSGPKMDGGTATAAFEDLPWIGQMGSSLRA
ncbi:hypothetical protein ACLOJK_004485 [Asimina triloba]